MSYSHRTERSAWLRQRHGEVASRLRSILPNTTWTPLEALERSSNSRLNCRCECGVERGVRVKDLLAGGSTTCRSCALRKRMAKVPEVELKAWSRRANEVPRTSIYEGLEAEFGAGAVARLRSIMAGARGRCTNPSLASYPDYGGRGITFDFGSVFEAVEYALRELGPPPEGRSIDRVDNNQGYTPGNLRWATRREQARNKRQYKRSAEGETIRRIMECRNDVTYETVRQWLAAGISEEEAKIRGKYERSGL